MSDDKPKIHAMARKLQLAADRIAERAPEDNATLLRAAADCIDVLWRIGEARAAFIEALRARELDATAAPVVAGEDAAAWRLVDKALTCGLRRHMTQAQYDANPKLHKWYEPYRCANCRTAAMAGD